MGKQNEPSAGWKVAAITLLVFLALLFCGGVLRVLCCDLAWIAG